MHPPNEQVLPVEHLTPEVFAPYGEVLTHGDREGRHYFEAPFSHLAPGSTPALWTLRLPTPATLPLAIKRLERHRFSAQTFIPLGCKRFLVIVAPSTPEGMPDLAGLRAFEAGPGIGVSYRPGTWHHGIAALEEPAEFVVIMAAHKLEDSDEFFDINERIVIE